MNWAAFNYQCCYTDIVLHNLLMSMLFTHPFVFCGRISSYDAENSNFSLKWYWYNSTTFSFRFTCTFTLLFMMINYHRVILIVLHNYYTDIIMSRHAFHSPICILWNNMICAFGIFEFLSGMVYKYNSTTLSFSLHCF